MSEATSGPLKFKRTTRFNKDGLSTRKRKDWISTCKNYRIYWRCEAFGIDMVPRFYALKYKYVMNRINPDTWTFATDRRPYKTFKKAYEACCKAAGFEIKETKRKNKFERRKQLKKITKTLEAPPIKVRKQRSDKGKPRKVPQEVVNIPAPESINSVTPVVKIRKQRSDKGKSRKTQPETEIITPVVKVRKQRSDKGQPRKRRS